MCPDFTQIISAFFEKPQPPMYLEDVEEIPLPNRVHCSFFSPREGVGRMSHKKSRGLVHYLGCGGRADPEWTLILLPSTPPCIFVNPRSNNRTSSFRSPSECALIWIVVCFFFKNGLFGGCGFFSGRSFAEFRVWRLFGRVRNFSPAVVLDVWNCFDPDFCRII